MGSYLVHILELLVGFDPSRAQTKALAGAIEDMPSLVLIVVAETSTNSSKMNLGSILANGAVCLYNNWKYTRENAKTVPQLGESSR